MKTFLRIALLAILPMLVNCGSVHENHVASLAAARQKLRTSREPSVLFVGNSFSQQVPGEFARIAEQHATPIRTHGVTKDSWTLSRHVKCDETLQTIRNGAWDVVILQEQSRLPARSPWMRRMKMRPPLARLADEVRSTGAVPLLMQTWGYRHGDTMRPDDTFHLMTERLRAGILDEAAHTGLPVIPVGDAWRLAYDRGHADQLFHADGKHPSKFGNRTTAQTVYEMLFPTNSSQAPDADRDPPHLTRTDIRRL